jgi:hypothetical protein
LEKLIYELTARCATPGCGVFRTERTNYREVDDIRFREELGAIGWTWVTISCHDYCPECSRRKREAKPSTKGPSARKET